MTSELRAALLHVNEKSRHSPAPDHVRVSMLDQFGKRRKHASGSVRNSESRAMRIATGSYVASCRIEGRATTTCVWTAGEHA